MRANIESVWNAESDGTPVQLGFAQRNYFSREDHGAAGWLDVALENQHVLNMSAIAETPATELGTMIVHTPGILGGKPRIKGHRTAVHRVAGWWKLGLTIEEIGERLPALAPAEIHAALAYYHLHREEIESYLEDDRAVCSGLERKRSTQP